MIQNLYGMNGVIVNGYSSWPNVSEYNCTPSTDANGRQCYNGDIKFINGMFYVFDCGSWQYAPTSMPSVGLSEEYQTAMQWAVKKMREEQKLEQLMERHKSIKDTKLQLDVLVALLKDSSD